MKSSSENNNIEQRENQALENITDIAELYKNATTIDKKNDGCLICPQKSNLTESFQQLMKHHPEFIKRFPQTMLASYLGITPETLSRIRKQLLSR